MWCEIIPYSTRSRTKSVLYKENNKRRAKKVPRDSKKSYPKKVTKVISMSLILSTGSNLGNKEKNLEQARKLLSQLFKPLAFSKVYQSEAVDYLDQPHFLNQVLEFEKPDLEPEKLMETILFLETKMGRKRVIKSGPRIIDIDIIFLGLKKVKRPNIIIPHPKLFERSFVLTPLQEVPFYQVLKNHFFFPQNLPNNAFAL